jgi:hypothetical protein
MPYKRYFFDTVSCVIQIINTAGESKTDIYISYLCKKVMADINLHAPVTSVSGFVMDSAAANRAAMKLLDADEDLPFPRVPAMRFSCSVPSIEGLVQAL